MPRKRAYAPAGANKKPAAGTVSARADEVRTERRRKRGSVALSGLKLTTDESKLDRNRFSYRWVRDSGSRMQQLIADDYDPAPEQAVEGNQGLGSVGQKIGGTEENGKPYGMVLMRKRKDWYDADQKEKARPLDEIDKQIKGGTVHEKDFPELRSGTYTPGGQNTIETA